MHLLHIIATLDPAAGGTSESVRVLLSHAPAGCTGEVVTLDAPNAAFLQNLPFTVHGLGPQKGVFGYTPSLIPWLKQNRDRFDGVIVNGLWQYIGYASRRAFHGRKPYIVFTHGMLDPWFKRQYPRKHFKKWLYWLAAEYWVLRGAHRVVFTTQEESRLARQSFWLHRWTSQVVSYGASRPTGASPARQVEVFHAACPEARAKRFLLFLGRIHPKKGCDLLIEAFANLAATDPNLHLVMAGPDHQGSIAALRSVAEDKGIASRVHWPGMITGDIKWGAFFASEAFILPSHQENFGLAVAESLACSRPVLLSHPVNISSDILEDRAGYVAEDTLAGTEILLRSWIETPPEERAAMSQRALACFDKRYNMHRNAEAICAIFTAAPNTHPGAPLIAASPR